MERTFANGNLGTCWLREKLRPHHGSQCATPRSFPKSVRYKSMHTTGGRRSEPAPLGPLHIRATNKYFQVERKSKAKIARHSQAQQIEENAMENVDVRNALVSLTKGFFLSVISFFNQIALERHSA